jgi:hypothetical protein
MRCILVHARRALPLARPSRTRSGSPSRLSRAGVVWPALACALAARKESSRRTTSAAHCSRTANGTVWLMRGAEDGEGSSRAGTPGADVLGPGVVAPAVAEATGQGRDGWGAVASGRVCGRGRRGGGGGILGGAAGGVGAAEVAAGSVRGRAACAAGVDAAPELPGWPGLPEKCAGPGLRMQGASQELDLRWLRGPRAAQVWRESGRPGLCWQSATRGQGELRTSSGPVRRAGDGYLSHFTVVVPAENRHEVAAVGAILRTDACQGKVADPLVLVHF